ncbi:MAG: tRNA (guanine(10)-N(2))-dimethyltransferase [archaeon]
MKMQENKKDSISQIIKEGKAKVEVFSSAKVSKELPVFYNPHMKLNRDISVLLLNCVDNKDMQIASPLAASGVREIRFLKELKKNKIKKVFLNDYSNEAVKLIKKNLKANSIKEKYKISCMDANLFLLNGFGFDYIDIDPFGSPNPFLDSSLVRISRGGILGVTATDTSALTGTYSNATKRKYASKPILNEFMHETGIRILIKKIQEIASQYEKALTPIFSYSMEHYFRVYFACEKGKTKVDEIIEQQGYILYCPHCLFRKTAANIFNQKQCPNCKKELDYAGKLWLGKLLDKTLTEKMLKKSDKKNKELCKLLETLNCEADIKSVGFYNISSIAKSYKIDLIPKIEKLIEGLHKKRFLASRTHFDGQGVRTDAEIKEIIALF